MLQDYVHSETYKRHAIVTEEIVYCYGEYQHAFDTVRNRVDFHGSFPDVHQLDARLRTLLILDDLMTEADNSIANVFTKISHHRNVLVVFLTENLFHQNKHISLNAHYIVLVKNPRDVGQFTTFVYHSLVASPRNSAADYIRSHLNVANALHINLL